jgi:putative DNA primase/helicase
MDWPTLKGVRKASFARGVEQFAQSDPAHAVTQECWDQDPMLLGVPGGIIDLRTGDLLPPDPAAGITRQTKAKPEGQARCPRWRAFLLEASGGDPEMIRFLQQWCGYCLTGLTREHALAFIFGPGKNGKSVFLNTVSGLLGDYAVTASMDTFTASRSDKHPTDLAMLKGARLVTASETEEGRAWAESRIKQMTGGDPITARFMRQDFFTFQPQFKLTIVGNHKPAIANVDDAMRRRFNIVPFTVKPANPDPMLEEKLREEFPSILRWMIDGCLDWQANGLMPPSSVSAATADYFNEQDLFGQWLTEECHVELGNLSRWETSSKLFDSWSDYARRSGELPGTQTRLGERLRRRGFTKIDRKVHGTTKKVWQGLELSGQVTEGRDAEN